MENYSQKTITILTCSDSGENFLKCQLSYFKLSYREHVVLQGSY